MNKYDNKIARRWQQVLVLINESFISNDSFKMADSKEMK